jgi:hypothetical protein
MPHRRARLSQIALALPGVFGLAACHETSAPLPPNQGVAAYPLAPLHARALAVTPGALVVAVVALDQVVAYADSQALAWKLLLPPGESLVSEPRVAADSTTHLLTNQRVHAISPDGKQRRARPLPPPFSTSQQGAMSWSLVLLPDSSVVLSDGSKTIVRLTTSGEESWRYSLPEGAEMAVEPVAGPNGSVYLRTFAWIYCVGSDGKLRWRVPLRALP